MKNLIRHGASQPKAQIIAALLVALSFIGMVGAEERSLPAGYVEGVWIESTGDQYIDTGYTHNGDTVVECEVDVASSGQPGNYAAVFGCNGADGGQGLASFEFWARHSAAMRPVCGMASGWVSGAVGDFPYDEWVKLRCDKTKAEWYPVQNPVNVKSLLYQPNGTPAGTFPIYIFGLNEKGTFVNKTKMKLRSFRIFEGGTLKMDFVPAKRLSDGAVGLVDVLDANPDTQFHANQGSGVFLFEEKRSLPAGYVEGVWIESTGDQYIDTGYTHNGDTVVECEVDVASGQPGNYSAVFGANGLNGSQSSTSFEFWARFQSAKKPAYEMYSSFVSGSVDAFPYDEWVKVRCDKTKAEWYPEQNPASVKSLSNSCRGTPSGTYSLYIFGVNEKGTFVNGAKMKLRSFRIFEGDTLKKDFVPAKRLADGKVGLFDVLDANPDTQFHVNQGSGEFLFVDVDSAMMATWTGGGSDPLNVADSANWTCVNFLGREVTAIPTYVTSVILPADVPFNCTNGAPFVCKEVIVPAVLTANCDWRGIAAPLVGNLNLNGYNLYLSDLNGTARIEATRVGSESGYQQVEYIESSGGQYIDTGYLHKGIAKVECDVDFSSTGQPGNYSAIFGANGTDGGKGKESFEFWAKHDKKMRPVCSMAASTWASGSEGDFPNDKWVTLTCVRDNATWCPMADTASTKSLRPHPTYTPVGEYPLYIFGLNEKGTCVNNAKMKLRRFRITEAGEVKRDFVPVRRLADQALGLLDLQDPNPETQFHGRKGTGDFTAGAALPDGVGGEVHVEIAAGKTVTNPSIALADAVKLVIEGYGTYKPIRHYQSYSGGTVVLGGTAWSSNSGDDHLYGVAGSEITIGENGTMEMDGTGASYDYSFVLRGGLLRNTTDRGNSSSSALIRRVRLEEDSAISFNGYSFSNHDWTPSSIDLGGHDLDLTVSGPCYFVNTVATNGTIVLHGDIEFFRGDFVGRGVTLDVDGSLGLNGVNVIVENYIARTEKTNASYNGDLLVYGKFKPVTDNFWGCVLQHGATLDLSDREGPWNVRGTLVQEGDFTKNTVSFADGATILVDLGNRKVKSGERVIAWDETTAPANLDTLKFKLKDGRRDSLWKAADGMYFPGGTMIYIR